MFDDNGFGETAVREEMCFYRRFAHSERAHLGLCRLQMMRFIASITRRQYFSPISHYHVLICRWSRN